jgi:hypothetical protein
MAQPCAKLWSLAFVGFFYQSNSKSKYSVYQLAHTYRGFSPLRVAMC